MKPISAVAQEWQSWVDDLPLDDVFHPAQDQLQEFIWAIANLAQDQSAEIIRMREKGYSPNCTLSAALAVPEVAALVEALRASRETHCGIAEHILQGGKNTKGIFADSQRARLAIDAALAAWEA